MNEVITLSRQLGSNGSAIATEVSKRLSLRYLDREILHRAAELAGFPDQTMIENLEDKEHRAGVLKKIGESLPSLTAPPGEPSATVREYSFFGTGIPLRTDGFNASYGTRGNTDMEIRIRDPRFRHELRAKAHAAKGYRALVERVVREHAEKGAAMIVGRGGQVLLSDTPGVLHVLIVAPESVRVRRVAERMGLDEKEARSRVRSSDKERNAYLKHFEKVSWLDPALYDLVINTGNLSSDYAVNVICDAARSD